MFIACTKCSSIPEGGHLCREPQSWYLKEEWLEQWQWSVLQQPWASRLLLLQNPRGCCLLCSSGGFTGGRGRGSAEPWQGFSSHTSSTPSLLFVLSSLKTNFHSEIDGFKIDYLKKKKSNPQKAQICCGASFPDCAWLCSFSICHCVTTFCVSMLFEQWNTSHFPSRIQLWDMHLNHSITIDLSVK